MIIKSYFSVLSFLKTSDKVLCSVTKNKAHKNKNIKADKNLK